MKLNERRNAGTVILQPRGMILGGSDCETLENTVRELVETGVQRLLLDLSETTVINSSGLGSIITCHSMLQKAGGHLKLLKVSEKVESLLIITKLLTVFETFSDEQVAVASFADET